MATAHREAAFGTALRAGWKAIALSGKHDPADWVDALDASFFRDGRIDTYVTLCTGYLDVTTGVSRLVNVGHPPPVLLEHPVRVLDLPPTPPLGLGLNDNWTAIDVPWAGQPMLLYTDGLVENPNRQGKPRRWGELGLLAWLDAHPHTAALTDLADRLVQSATTGRAIRDDIAILIVAGDRYRGRTVVASFVGEPRDTWWNASTPDEDRAAHHRRRHSHARRAPCRCVRAGSPAGGDEHAARGVRPDRLSRRSTGRSLCWSTASTSTVTSALAHPPGSSSLGFEHVHDLIGGRAAWTALGLPTEGTAGDRHRISAYAAEVPTIDIDAMLADVVGLAEQRYPVPVVDRDGVLLGAVEPSAAAKPATTPVEDVMAPAPRTIRPEVRLDDAREQLCRDRLDHVFVTAVNGVLVGRIVAEFLPAT